MPVIALKDNGFFEKRLSLPALGLETDGKGEPELDAFLAKVARNTAKEMERDMAMARIAAPFEVCDAPKRQKSAYADFCLSTIQRLASFPDRHQNRVRIPTRAAIWLLEPLPELPKKLELEPISACTGTPLLLPVAF